MVAPREALSTVTFIDHYCTIYRSLFANVRSFEAFKFLHLGNGERDSAQIVTRDCSRCWVTKRPSFTPLFNRITLVSSSNLMKLN